MSNAVDILLALIDEADPCDQDRHDIVSLQLQAAQERIEERRAQIPVLDKRLRDLDVNKVGSLQDLVPLLFSHTTYKSYPESFVSKAHWDRLLAWYASLAVGDTEDVDLSNVTDLDSWVAALWDAGHYAYASSGTSGKCSFLPALEGDRENPRRMLPVYWPRPMPVAPRLRWYQLMPRTGCYRAVDFYRLLAKSLADPDAMTFLGDQPMLVSDINRVASVRKAMADGTASPAQVAALEVEAAERAEHVSAAMRAMALDLIAHRDEPLVVVGLWPQQFELVQLARELGASDGGFHPDSVVMAAGGSKGVKLPSDYKTQVLSFYEGAVRPQMYGMTELTSGYPRCEAGRYHEPPWCITLVLDQSGERLLNTDHGRVQGRAAFLDLGVHGRWGGIVTGDRITVDFDRCECGRPGPTVSDDVARYTDLEGSDDKLSCAGTMEAYVRGAIGA